MGLARVAQRNPRLFGQHPQCFPETDSFPLLDKAENIASDVADPAFPGLAIGIDLQTWVRVVMPWADGRKASPLATQIEVTTDQVHDVCRFPNAFLGVKFDDRRHSDLPG